jgi:hypothetical protein
MPSAEPSLPGHLPNIFLISALVATQKYSPYSDVYCSLQMIKKRQTHLPWRLLGRGHDCFGGAGNCMGIAVSGVIFDPPKEFDVSILNRAFALSLEKIEGKVYLLTNPKFDPRNKGDFIVHRGDRHICIMNSGVADDLLFTNDLTSYHVLSREFPAVDRMIFFCLYDSGGSYGYSAFADGELIRSKLYIVHEGHVESGIPLPAEGKWQPAILTAQEIIDEDFEDGDERRFFRHVTTGRLAPDTLVNSYIVDELLRAEYGWSPFDDDHPSKNEYYRAAEAEHLPVSSEPATTLGRQPEASSIRSFLRRWFR